MELLNTLVTDISEDTKRITGLVKYDDGFEEEYWFEYPAQFSVSETGNPWLAALLPMAATIGEDLVISLPIDPRLLDAANDIMRIWKSWEFGTTLIKVVAKNGTSVIENYPKDSASFFSSGVDAFYTAYMKPRTKYKILIHGFDININKTEEFKIHFDRISQAVDELGETIIPVRTNIRETRWKATRWQRVSHGSALASIGLLFEKHFHELFISSSHNSYADLNGNGSHPLSDPLYSTTRTNIIHDGDGVNRSEKIEYLSHKDLALKHLHVCIRGKEGTGQDEVNCSHCEKCYRTMIAFDLYGGLEKCELFDLDKYNYYEVGNVFVISPDNVTDYLNMADMAKDQGKIELSNGIHKSLRRSKWIRRSFVLQEMPILWRIPHKLIENSIF